MQRFPLPLKFSIPVILLLMGGVLSVFSCSREIAHSFHRVEEDASRQTRFFADQTSGTLEYLFRTNDVEGANLVISKLSGNSSLNLAILVDDHDQPILSTRYELRNQPIHMALTADDLAAVRQVRDRLSGQATLSDDRHTIRATYPVLLGSVPGELRPSRIGVLVLKYDLSELKQRARNDALKISIEGSAVLTLFCFTVWLFFYKTLTQRVARLVRASNKLAEGDLKVRAGLKGSDELRQISTAFDRMADNLQVSQQQLHQLAERRALLNDLASQIRKSLELEDVLQTAVTEIRELFGIARCQFFWCELEQNQPQFLPIAKACCPEDTTCFTQSTLQEIGSIRQQILTEGMLCIQDVDNHHGLDAVSRSQLADFGVRSMFVTVLQTRSNRLGVIVCEHTSARTWADDEIDVLKSVADQLAIAIDQAELYEQSRTTATIAASQAEQLKQAFQELQHTQAQLIQTEKMSSLGQMVAGVAHEINNPVNFIYGNLTHIETYTEDLLMLVQLYEQRCQNTPDIQEVVDNIDLEFVKGDLPKIIDSMRLGTDRIREIVLTLRNFSRLDEAEMKPVNLHEGIESTLLILQSELKGKPPQREIRLIKQYGDLPEVECYAGQLNQVLLNVIKNAIDALHEFDRQAARPEQSMIAIETQMLDSDWVRVAIKDNGPGISETVREKIFDPFFTTKPVGEGTGLGLSISYQIVVDKHRGRFQCFSELGQGTEFWIDIPIAQNQTVIESAVVQNALV